MPALAANSHVASSVNTVKGLLQPPEAEAKYSDFRSCVGRRDALNSTRVSALSLCGVLFVASVGVRTQRRGRCDPAPRFRVSDPMFGSGVWRHCSCSL